ncbi:ABC transporter ATP-binding protein/permease [Schaalia sp. ZJ1691]|uniref:ABC transporter ATP-binding protein/permease n=1 Tax=Schaalia sp. ZJ1691 TaxID=2709404 RepID=UPI0013EAB916|nr:ABC transporter ATP-binding protein/permease [Schaalia sp. ZJ1691]
MLELRSVTKSYTTASLTQVALDNVSLAFRDNEFVAVLGHSGSGKTTMLNIIGGLDQFDDGDLVIDGTSTRHYRNRQWDTYRNNRIGFVFQSYNLIPHQTVLANVELALTLSGVSRAQRQRRALEALEQVGLADHVRKRPAQLSGGQMQRVAIARALVNDPEIVLADEPTGALDSKTSVQVMDLLREVANDRLVIMVTHNPELAHEYATRIVELTDGRITADSHPFVPGTVQARPASAPRKTSMSLATALSLSANNLMTKKGRTVMTSFAGSIGIIGIAAILALANGVNAYIAKTQEEALNSYPLTIQETSVDLTKMMKQMPQGTGGEGSESAGSREVGSRKKIEVQPSVTSMTESTNVNDLRSLKAYVDSNGGKINDHVTAIEYAYDVEPQIYQADTSEGIIQVNPDRSFAAMNQAYGSGAFSPMMTTSSFHQLPRNAQLYEKNYEVVAGDWPKKPTDLVMVLDQSGKILDVDAYTLGLRPHAELEDIMEKYYSGRLGDIAAGKSGNATELEAQSAGVSHGAHQATFGSYSYDDIIGTEFARVNAADRYTWDENFKVWTDRSEDVAFMKKTIASGEKLTVTGIVRAKDPQVSLLRQGLNYSAKLTDEVMAQAASSKIVESQLANPTTDVFTGKTFSQLEKEVKTGAESAVDFSKLFTVDGEKLRAAFAVDSSALERELSALDLTGMDLSGVSLSAADLSSLDMSRLAEAFDPSQLAGAVDLSTIDWSTLDLSDLSTIYPQLANIDVAALLSTALKDGAVKDGAGEYLAGALVPIVQGLSDALRQGVHAAGDEDGDGVPDVDLGVIVSHYFESDEVKRQIDEIVNSDAVIDEDVVVANLAQALREDPALTAIARDVSQTFARAIGQQISTQLGGAVASSMSRAMGNYLSTAMSGAMTQMMTTIQDRIAGSLESAMSQLMGALSTSMNMDPGAFAQAFRLNMDQSDLAAVMSTFMTRQVPSYEQNLRTLGWGDVHDPSLISIYPKSFDSKDAVKGIIDSYNEAKTSAGKEAQVITYTDMVGLLMSQVTSIIDMISWMLIAFVSISLIVSSIMISIITYISVLERKKEIGILRSIGASRRDISHVFNAETVIEGLLAGIMGVVITLGLAVVANITVEHTLGVENIAQLPLLAAIVLILISVVLTLIAGLVPSARAAREDPVEALRAE